MVFVCMHQICNITQLYVLQLSGIIMMLQNFAITSTCQLQNFHQLCIPSSGKFHQDLSTQINSLWPSDAIWWHKSLSTLAQVMVCCLSAPNHNLNQCWLVIKDVLWHSWESNFTRSAYELNLLNMCSEITLLKSIPHLPGANELRNGEVQKYSKTPHQQPP